MDPDYQGSNAKDQTGDSGHTEHANHDLGSRDAVAVTSVRSYDRVSSGADSAARDQRKQPPLRDGSGANFKKRSARALGRPGETESLACEIGPKFKICTRSCWTIS